MDDIGTNYYLEAQKKVGLILLLGQDPYPKKPTSIAFCKEEKVDLFAGDCCGKTLLEGLGFSEDDFDQLESGYDIFFYLLRAHAIVFSNASSKPLENKKVATLATAFEESRERNVPLIERAVHIVTLGDVAWKCVKHFGFEEDERVRKVRHPARGGQTKVISALERLVESSRFATSGN